MKIKRTISLLTSTGKAFKMNGDVSTRKKSPTTRINQRTSENSINKDPEIVTPSFPQPCLVYPPSVLFISYL